MHDVETLGRHMVVQWIAQLRAPLQLPQALKILGFLRRLDLFNESQLRLLFLEVLPFL